MKYEKAQIEVVKFDHHGFFMTNSPIEYPTAEAALQAACGGYNGGGTNNFTCSSFGGYSESNPPSQNAQVTLGGGQYVFDYKGNHWKCSVVH